jgi:PPOX class probable FMN-dependent enzyme
MRAEDILPGDADTAVRDGVAIRKGTVGAAPEAPAPAAPDLGAPDLDALYAPPSPMIQQHVRDHLVDVHEAYLKVATFFCLATASGNALDASPRGGPPGFVRVLDPRTVAFADWPGNNRIASLRNLRGDSRVGMLFLFPGFDAFLRINGHAAVGTDPALLERLAENGRVPKAATVVHVNEVLFHCGKAANRARLWDPASRIDPATVPSVGKVISALSDTGGATIEQLDAHYAHEVRHQLY